MSVSHATVPKTPRARANAPATAAAAHLLFASFLACSTPDTPARARSASPFRATPSERHERPHRQSSRSRGDHQASRRSRHPRHHIPRAGDAGDRPANHVGERNGVSVGGDVRIALGAKKSRIAIDVDHTMRGNRALVVRDERDGVAHPQRRRLDGLHVNERPHRIGRLHAAAQHGERRIAQQARRHKGQSERDAKHGSDPPGQANAASAPSHAHASREGARHKRRASGKRRGRERRSRCVHAGSLRWRASRQPLASKRSQPP